MLNNFLERDQKLAQSESQVVDATDFLCRTGSCDDSSQNNDDAAIQTFENNESLYQPGFRLKASANATLCYTLVNTPYLCPNTQVCTSDYNQCTYYNITICNALNSFRCGNGKCVQNMKTECCPANQIWCPHTNKCVNSTDLCCSLNTTTPFFCKSTNTCVQFQWQCCSNLYAKPGLPLVKCSNEPKCVPANNATYCFTKTQRSCTQVGFTQQCPFDGLCVRNVTECPSPKVCPLGYYMCPDGTCLPGLAQQSQCASLPTCLIGGVQYLRCSDGKTCVNNYDQCPTQISCLNSTQVVCPDGTCADSSFSCVQPPSLRSYASCGPLTVRCPDGTCNYNCTTVQGSCLKSGNVTCPDGSCASSYDLCADQTFCPLSQNYTYLPSSIQCGYGPKICTWDTTRCMTSTCQNGNQLCADGRCQSQCLTEISCSPGYIKSGGIGILCIKSKLQAAMITSLAYQLSQLTCPDGMVTCLTGVCRQSIYDCPQFSTCPPSLPIQCLDGQCVASKTNCAASDANSNQASINCFQNGLLLCISDMKTCVAILDQCPTMSTCYPGQIKCSENSCVVAGQQCPTTATCNSNAPLFQRNSNSCVQSYSSQDSIICPYDAPVLCAIDLTCKRNVYLCGQNSTSVQPVSTPYCPHNTCSNGTCTVGACPEWLICPPNQLQCFNGMCVSDAVLCPLTSNGCPQTHPVFCPYLANCVSVNTNCNSGAKTQLNSKCSSSFKNQPIGCPLGNCVDKNSTCAQQYISACNDDLYPNSAKYSDPNLNFSICYVPQCPPQLPYKCQNGLCVKEAKYCPSQPFGIEEIQNCKNQSIQYGLFTPLTLPFPCGDGSCRTSSDQCIPLYNCSLNTALNATVRCGDGSCANQLSQCPQLTNKCPITLPFMCQSGQCAENKSSCLSNENGCPQSTPYRCESNGACYVNKTSCYSTFQLMNKLNLSLVKNNNICTQQGKVACFTENLIYCASSLSQCFQVPNGCPVSTPIYCNGQCFKTVASCKNVTVSTSNIVNSNGCPQLSPFRCSKTSYSDCQKLPYSSFWQNYNNTCQVQSQKLTTGWGINSCVSQLQPYSCVDGTCVQQSGDCQTCPYICQNTMTCGASASDCNQNGQTCPVGIPIRCMVSGQCVASSLECTYGFGFSPTQIDQNFRGILIDHNCPALTPIRCQNGTCVAQQSFCLQSVSYSASAFVFPVSWAPNPPTNVQVCRVYCSDGSCRDRQENCPLTQACISPARPYRCNSGICAANSTECLLDTNAAVQNEYVAVGQPSQQSFICRKEMNSNQTFYRCEDGTCRPNQKACLQFLGCPLTEPYQCPTGQCVYNMTDCLQYSHSFCKGKYMCSNMACVEQPDQCFFNRMLVPVTQIEVNLNPLMDYTVDFAYIYDVSIGRLQLPSGSIPIQMNSINSVSDLIQRITILPVPYSYLQKLSNPINQTAINYTEAYYNLSMTSPRSLSVEQSILSPIVNITNINNTNQSFNDGAMIEFSLNKPESMELISDLCLATVNNQLQLTCVSRNITVVGQLIRMPLNSTGVYAVIFNPDMSLKIVQPKPPLPTVDPISNVNNQTNTTPTTPPTPVPISEPVVTPNPECDTMWCKYKNVIIIAGSCGVVLLILMIVFLVWCLKCRKPKEVVVESEQNDHAELKPVLKKKKAEQPKKEEEKILSSSEPGSDEDNVKIETKKVKIQDKSKQNQQQYGEQNIEKKHEFGSDSDQKMIATIEAKKDKNSRKPVVQKVTDHRQEEESKTQINQDLIIENIVAEKDSEIKNLLAKLRELEREKDEKAKKSADVEKMNAKMKAHYQKEVERIKKELQKEIKEIKQPNDINSDENEGTYYSIPTQETGNTFLNYRDTDGKNYQSKDADKLSAQWHNLVNQYLPDADLLSENSRPLIVNDQRTRNQVPKIVNKQQQFDSEQKKPNKLEVNKGKQISNFNTAQSGKQPQGNQKNKGMDVDFTY